MVADDCSASRPSCFGAAARSPWPRSLLPLAGLAGRRRWAGFALGGALAVLLLMLVP